ncbi:MAG TPA: Mur ligase family protein [Bacillota bacterium]|nr:Mur ligase family protein [Bacillota bacterium]
MNVESPEGLGVTADLQKVRPGMIFVDLSYRRNKRRIYEAYDKGASLIFTPHDITDPDLPVINVGNHRDTLYKMFDRLFGNRGKMPKLIGVFGESDKSVLIELIQSIFYRADDEILTDVIPISVNTNAGNISCFDMNFDCAILADRSTSEGNNSRPVPDMAFELSKKKNIIINNDEYSGIKAAEDLAGVRSITYGLNKKAVVTASSIDVNEITCFNYCVQKSFYTRKGERIEPFEIPIRLNAMGSHNVYNALAAITCGLYYDKDIGSLKNSIERYKASSRHFQKIYDGEYVIIDNYCSSIYDYTAVFDSIQILSYENLILIISVSQSANPALHGEKARLITEWARILKCKEVILTSCMDGDSHIGELPLKSMRIYKRIFKENDVTFRYYHLLHHAIDKSLLLLEKHDLLVMLGGDEMNAAQRILCNRLGLINNK